MQLKTGQPRRKGSPSLFLSSPKPLPDLPRGGGETPQGGRDGEEARWLAEQRLCSRIAFPRWFERSFERTHTVESRYSPRKRLFSSTTNGRGVVHKLRSEFQETGSEYRHLTTFNPFHFLSGMPFVFFFRLLYS